MIYVGGPRDGQDILGDPTSLYLYIPVSLEEIWVSEDGRTKIFYTDKSAQYRRVVSYVYEGEV